MGHLRVPAAAVQDTPVSPPADDPAPGEPPSASATAPQNPALPGGAPCDTAAASPAVPSEAEHSPAECAARLAELFPALFAAVPNTPPKPIKLRIQADIQARAPGLFSRRSLSPFLHRHTTTTSYLKALITSTHRYDLDGAPAGEVSDEHRQAAQAELDRRWAIVQARRAAERAAQRGAATAAATSQATPGDGPPPGEGGRPGRPPRDRRPQRQQPDVRDGRSTSQRLRSSGPPPQGDRPPREHRPSRPDRTDARTHNPARRQEREPQRSTPAQSPLPDDPARRERALLLRAYESTTLSRANFCALKRIAPEQLDALLEQARSEARGSDTTR